MTVGSEELIDELVEEYRQRLERWHTEGFDAVFTARDGERTRAVFRDKHEVVFDEPVYTIISDGDKAPCPHDYLIAAAAGCQAETIKQCLEKARVEEYEVCVEAESRKEETAVDDDLPEYFNFVIPEITSSVTISVPAEYESEARRCSEVFERNCVMSQSVQRGIDVEADAAVDTY